MFFPLLSSLSLSCLYNTTVLTYPTSPYLPPLPQPLLNPISPPHSAFSTTMTTHDTYCGSTPSGIKMDTIRCFSDNNCYVLRDDKGFITIVDPGEPESVIPGLLKLNINLDDDEQLQKTQILITHHHWDHSGGNKFFSTKYPTLPILGGAIDNPEHVNRLLANNELFQHGEYTFVPHHTPCHTKGHICFFFYKSGDETEQNDTPLEGECGIFTGDTLFSAGCGKFFEGTAEQMFKNMSFFRSLPPQTFVYDGHEYSKSNLTYCQRCEPNNPDISRQLEWISKHPNVSTHPSTIELELKINSFMRAGSVDVLHQLRESKNKGAEVVLKFSELR